MPPPGYRLKRFAHGHHLAAFSCGVLALDRWLQEHALNADWKGTARSYVWVDESDEVIAYFSLAPHLVVREQVPPKVGRGSPDQIPSVLLARLALHASHQGKGYGGILLVEALIVAVNAIKRVGGRLIMVDAIDANASAFYEKHGFTPSPDPNRLVMKASDASKSLGLPWP